MDQLIDHANALINTAKTFVTKPVGCKHSQKHTTVSHVEKNNKTNVLDVLHVVTMDKLATLQVETDSSSKPRTADSSGVKCRKIKCKMCVEIFGSVKELNSHHK